MNVSINEFNEFWAKVCQLYNETGEGDKRVFLFQDNYECEELWGIEDRESFEDGSIYFTTKLQFCSVKHGVQVGSLSFLMWLQLMLRK